VRAGPRRRRPGQVEVGDLRASPRRFTWQNARLSSLRGAAIHDSQTPLSLAKRSALCEGLSGSEGKPSGFSENRSADLVKGVNLQWGVGADLPPKRRGRHARRFSKKPA